MKTCILCNGKVHEDKLTDDIFNIDGRYVLVTGVPVTVCKRCGEKTFTAESTEKVRRLIHEGPKTSETVPLEVYKYG